MKIGIVRFTFVTLALWLINLSPVAVRANLDRSNLSEIMRTRTKFVPLVITAHSQAKQTDEPAEKVYKNIQVFKGLPSEQLIQAMFFMRGALGASCNECHVNFRDFEKDDNPKKQIARQMIEMVRSLNQKNFGGREVINCNTCHRGQTKPAAPLAFAAIINSATPRATMAGHEDSSLTVDQIFEKYVLATGGRSALEKLNTAIFSGSMLSSEGWTAPLKIYKATPERVLVTFKIDSVFSEAFSGTKGWGQDNHGLHDMAGVNLARLRRKAAFFQPLSLKEQYSALRSLGIETIEDHRAYVIEGIMSDAESEKLYFDVDSGFLVRITSRTETPLGSLPHQIDISDYRSMDGVKLPFIIDDLAPDFSSVYRISDVKLNTPIEKGFFDKPAALSKGNEN